MDAYSQTLFPVRSYTLSRYCALPFIGKLNRTVPALLSTLIPVSDSPLTTRGSRLPSIPLAHVPLPLVTMLKDLVAVSAGVLASVTRIVKSLRPGQVGVPEITPLELNDSPLGRLPVWRNHVVGFVPPSVASVAEYGVPVRAEDKVEVITR